MNKSGGELSPVVYLILLLLAAAVLIMFVGSLNKSFNDIKEVEPCRLSLAALSKIDQKTFSSSFPIKCPVHQLTIGKHSATLQVGEKSKDVTVYLNGKKIKHYDPDKEVFYQLITRELFKCWYKTGAGKISGLGNPLIFPDAKSRCLICSEISPTPSLDNKVIINNWDDYIDWLSIHNVPDKTYNYSYFFSTAANWPNLLGEFTDSFEPEKKLELSGKYVIVFAADRRSKLFKLFGDDSFRNYLLIMPAENVADYCGEIIYQLS